MKAITTCPHHGYEHWDIVNRFYDGLTTNMKQLLESMCSGSFIYKSLEDSLNVLGKVVELTRG